MNMAFLKTVNWKKIVLEAVPVFTDFRVAALVFLNVFMMYAISWDTVIRPALGNIVLIDSAIGLEKVKLAEYKKFKSELGSMRADLKSLKTHLITISPDDSSRLVSAQEAATIKRIIEGSITEERSLPDFPAVAFQPRIVSIEPKAATDVDIVTLNPTVKNILPEGVPETSQVFLKEFEYKVEIESTYANLLDVMNELTLRKNLIRIKKISIAPAQSNITWNAEKKPIQLKMDLLLSTFIFEDDSSV